MNAVAARPAARTPLGHKPRGWPAAEEDRWGAVAGRNPTADGAFVYAVRTTGVYCRPSCGARLARRENVEFHATPADAERAGFRACKRCRPDDPSPYRAHADAVARACGLVAGAAQAPDVDALAAAAGMSRSHFHRVFKSLTGLTPKAYSTALRSRRVRDALSHGDARRGTVTSALYDAGFNSSGRFYATSTRTLGMKPTAFRAGGAGATVRFAVGECSLGLILVAASKYGVCAVALGDDPDALVRDLKRRFPKAELATGGRTFDRWVVAAVALVERPAAGLDLPLDVQGTAFQHRVWEKLREIPCGQTWSYARLAREMGLPRSARAAARACAANPVAVAIPCHRVVRTDGTPSGYRWGLKRKAKLLAAERAHT